MGRRAELISVAADDIDIVIMERSAVLFINQLLAPEEYLDLYREPYFRIEEAAIADMSSVLAEDLDSRLSIWKDFNSDGGASRPGAVAASTKMNPRS